MKRSLPILLAGAVLVSCSPPSTPQQKAFLHELADRPVTCDASRDCDAKWDRAVRWISVHNSTGMHTVSEKLIATNLMSTGGRQAYKYPEFTVVRYAAVPGQERMDFTSYCEHGFVCGEQGLKLRADFVTFVMGPPPGVSVSPDGTRATKVLHADGD